MARRRRAPGQLRVPAERELDLRRLEIERGAEQMESRIGCPRLAHGHASKRRDPGPVDMGVSDRSGRLMMPELGLASGH